MANLNLNKVILGGRLTADVELKQTNTGISVCSFSIAVNRKANNKVTDFIDIVAWRKTAEFIATYFCKGSSIVIVGELQKREWQDNQGNKRYATEVIADEAYFVDSQKESQALRTPTQNPYLPPMRKDEPKLEEIPSDEDLPF